MAKPKKPVGIYKTLNGHSLYAEPGVTGWYFSSDTLGQIAEQYDGCHDPAPALELFKKLAAAEAPRKGEAA